MNETFYDSGYSKTKGNAYKSYKELVMSRYFFLVFQQKD